MARWLTLALVAVLLIEGCGKECGGGGCFDGWEASVDLGSAAPPETYVLDFQSDVGHVTFTCELSLDKSEQQCCQGTTDTIGACPVHWADGRKTISLVAFAHPKTIALTIEKNGSNVGTFDVQPDYKRIYPEGRECGGSCDSAKSDFSIP